MLTDETARIHIKNFEILPPQELDKCGCAVIHRVMVPTNPISCPAHIWMSNSDTPHNHSVPPAYKLSTEQKDAIIKLASTMKRPTVTKIIEGNSLD
jgi:hypothetical protein